MIVRSVTLDDFDQLWGLIEQATYGMTTLQITREQLRERVELSNFAFGRSTEKASGEPYVFVMEDQETGQLAGLSCIFSKTGGYEPFYSYRRMVESSYSELLDKTVETEFLQLAKIHDGPTEIGSLFLLPDFRGKGRGRLLSLSRFAFIAAHPMRFDSQVIAEMRGVMTDDGKCIFWEAIGRHFFAIDFPQADSLSTLNKRFIENLMPKHSIYTCLLSPQAQAIMGEVHENTRPALAMLQSEGFEISDLIDIFDGGPVVQCPRDEIKAVRRCHERLVSAKTLDGTSPDDESCIVSSHGDSFRASLSTIRIDGDDKVMLSSSDAAALHVEAGQKVRCMSLYPQDA